MKTRFGKFSLADELIHDRGSHDALKKMFGKMIIVETRFDVSRRCIDYTAIADIFEECETHLMPPQYEILFTRHGAGPKAQMEISARPCKFQDARPGPVLDVGRKVRWRAMIRAIREFFLPGRPRSLPASRENTNAI